jgi:hypothetical protein
LISWAIKTYTWHQYRVYLDIQALQVSLLGGRIFFTGLRYHGNNETFFVQNGHITWRYWLRRVRDVDIRTEQGHGDVNPKAGEKREELPCRINISLIGLEWFVYNRSAAYDTVLNGLVESLPTDRVSGETESGDKASQNIRNRSGKSHEKSKESRQAGVLHKRTAPPEPMIKEKSGPGRQSDDNSLSGSEPGDQSSDGPQDDDSELPFLLQLFPIYVECEKAALVMGNDNTKAVLIVKTDSLSGEINAASNTTPDPYRQIFNFNLQHPIAEMKDNEDYSEDQASRATKSLLVAQENIQPPRRSFFRRKRRKVLGQLRNMVPYWRKSVESLSIESRSALGTAASQIPGSGQWQGLSRYLNEYDQDDKAKWSAVEYAAVSTIADCPEATLTIYWDSVGRVPRNAPHRRATRSGITPNINGDEPPAWGINLSLKGGTINYGPWADRQRADLQRVFFPSLCKDATPAKPLSAGSFRVPTQFKLFVEIEEELNFRVPIREESKNWRWKGQEPKSKSSRNPDKRKQKNRNRKGNKEDAVQLRPPGWLDLKVASNTTVSFTMDMFASGSGFTTALNVDLPRTEISSSVNQEILLRSGSQRISCDLSTPLQWNALREWRFDIVGDDLELFLLRDHVFLMIDLVDDWATGPPPEYLIFTPFKYYINLELMNLKLYLNVNDANIINRPTNLDDNTYIVLTSPGLTTNACIPIDNYRPSGNVIPFEVKADNLAVSLHVPPWNTQATFLSSKEIGQGENLAIDGKYHYNATTSPANTDTLVLNVTAQSVAANLYGFVIRYFLKIKDNYLGDDIHFRTLEEYQTQLQLKECNPDAELANKPPQKKSNDLDVILSARVDEPRILLPANLYSSKRHIQIETACLSIDLRFTNYYMDLDMRLSPLNLSLGNSDDGMETPISTTTTSTQLFIDGVHIYGHRLFGLPPTEPTYLCNWDLSVGTITGECTADFLAALMRGAKAFAFSFDDDENALVSYSSIIFYDVTFLRVAVQSIRLWLHLDESAFLFSTGSIDVNFNDWARSHYSKRANIKIPDLQFSCVNSESAARHRNRFQHPVETEAVVRTSIHLAVIMRKYDFSQERKLQQELVRCEDQRTQRTEFLLLPGLLEELIPDSVDPPAQCVPPIPQPALYEGISEDSDSLRSGISSTRSHRLRSKSSFLSLSSSSQESVARPRSSWRDRSKSKQSDRLRPETPGTEGRRPSMHQREFSTSTGRHSAFYSAVGDMHGREALQHSSVTFSSQFFPPYFPLEGVNPDISEAILQSVEVDEDQLEAEALQFGLDDIDPEGLSEDRAHSSVLVEFPSGVAAFFNPTSVKYLLALFSALQPHEPEDILDDLQVGSMTGIFDLKKQEKFKCQITDLLVRVPRANVRFINCGLPDSPALSVQEQDQYDLTIARLALMSRTNTKWGDPFKSETKSSRSSLHLRLGSAEASASERSVKAEDTHAAVMVQIERIMVSMGSKDVRYIDADVGLLRSSAASGRVEYLASLIHRTNLLAKDLGETLMQTVSRHKDHLKYFTYHLLTDGHQTPDPSFLTRPSAVLRSASQHLRTFDSWKLAVRLRRIWSRMSPSAQNDLHLDYFNSTLKVPEDAAQQVVGAFQRWRSWDLDDLSESVLLRDIFGKLTTPDQPNDDSLPLLLAFALREAAFILDPGPKQNCITLSDLSTRLQKKSDIQDETTELSVVHGPLTLVNIHCGDAALSLNWELCELLDDILKLYIKSGKDPTAPSPPASFEKRPQESTADNMHVVLAVERGSVELETVNLSAKSLSHNLKASFLQHGTSGGGSASNFILSCNAVTSRLHSHSQLLGMFQLREPSVFASHELQETESTSSHTIKTTASSQALSLVVKQDPIGLLEIADRLIRDEVAQLYRIKERLPSSPKPKTRNKKITERLSAFRVNVALFLDEYHISLPLLPTMTYNISGVVARAAMAANFGKEIIFDFDVKQNLHGIQVYVQNEPRDISLLRIPPTNGRITTHMSQSEHVATVFASVEVVKLDASALYALLSALNRPQISSTINDIQDQSKLIQEHLEEIFGSQSPAVGQVIVEPKLRLIYTVHLTLAGLEVLGKTALNSTSEPSAILQFSLDGVHLEATNRLDSHGPVLPHPELHINLRHIMFDIGRGREEDWRSCGSLGFGALLSASSRQKDVGIVERSFAFRSDVFEVILSPETISTLVEVLGYMGDKIKDLDTSREMEFMRRLRQTRPRIAINDEEEADEPDIIDSFLSSITYQFEIRDTRLSWLVADSLDGSSTGKEDLILSIQLIELGTRANKSARLTIENFQLQMVPSGQDRRVRSLHSALMPEMIFNIAYVSTADARRLAFQAVGKSLDLRLTPAFIIPAAHLNNSITLSAKNAQRAAQHWSSGVVAAVKEEPAAPRRSILGTKRLESLLVDADFAGAVVHISAKKTTDEFQTGLRSDRPSLAGKYGQFNTDESGSSTVLRSPGLAWKLQYRDDGREDPALSAEIKIDASSNILYPSVVSLIMDMTASVKEVVSDDSDSPQDQEKMSKSRSSDEDNILTADPSAVLGRLQLNLGLRICKQEFSLSCQPIARVAATARFEDIYITVNTVRSVEQGNFFAISGQFTNLQASVQHVYSRESTGSFEVESIVVSLMNSKHVSGTSGVSAMIKVSPMKVSVNAKQLQDFLLFREIWYPNDLGRASSAPVAKLVSETSQGHLVQRYQQVAATAAFPWTATISISSLDVNVDLGQAVGKSLFAIKEFWISSKKTSDWEQNLCLGFDNIGVDCTGRLSGFVALQDFKLRTSIEWPEREQALNETPRIQASIGFSQFRLKAAFDYQAFLIADITTLSFLMYNVRRRLEGNSDRLVATFDGEAVQVFGTTNTASQLVALYQAIQKLIQERRSNFETSLVEIEKVLRRKSVQATPAPVAVVPKLPENDTMSKSPISLDTDVVVTLKALNLGVFPSTFSDHQVFKIEALNAQARFAASIEQRRIHSILGLTLGQLRIGLAGVRDIEAPKTLSEISVEDVVKRATGSRGGTILKVPKVEAVMQTWQRPNSSRIEYIFRSAFEGKVEVGWNYSRISYIRGMWANHSKTLEQTWGKEIPLSAIKVTGVPEAEEEGKEGSQQKITAEVNVPQSKYDYVPLEAPIIETPQLRDMGEATPPLEWIGLHRDRLPNLTHQIVIVSLLELAGEVEDAYSRILGSS